MSFQQGLSGLNAASKALDVVGNNIANSSTIGFKAATAHFSDVFANSLAGAGAAQVGIGTSTSAIQQSFTQGNITRTNNPLDIAISGSGFYQMSTNGTLSYSRNGQFHVDNSGFIVDDAERNLTGYLVTGGVIDRSQAKPLQISSANIDPVVTGSEYGVRASLNLDSRSVTPTKTFDRTDPTTYTFSTATTIYDSLGNAHAMTIFARKTMTQAAGAAAGIAANDYQTAAQSYKTAADQLVSTAAGTPAHTLAAQTARTAAQAAADLAAELVTAANAAVGAANDQTVATSAAAQTAANTAKTNADAALAAATAAFNAATNAAAAAATATASGDPADLLAAQNAATAATTSATTASTSAATATASAVAVSSATTATIASATRSDWDIYTSIDGQSVDYVTNAVNNVPRNKITMSFDSSGALVGAPDGGTELSIDLNGVMAAQKQGNSAAPQLNFKLDFAGTTQFGSASGTNSLVQDGYTTGRLTGISVGADGTIQGNYSNGQSSALGQVVLANFTNPNGLASLGGNQWAATAASNSAQLGAPNTGTLGVLQAAAIEESNTDLTAELVNMITQQRNYQASAQTIKTQDQIMQTLVNLR